MIQVTRNLTALARNISEGIVNGPPFCSSPPASPPDKFGASQPGHARRQPINFAHFNSALSVLSTTRATLDLLSSHITLAALTPDHISPHLPRMSHTLVVSWATLHLPLYRELRRRMEQALEGGVELDQDEAARTEALSNDVRRATWNAAILLAQAVRDAPRFAFPLTRLEEWTQVVLAEGETAAALGMEQRPTVAL